MQSQLDHNLSVDRDGGVADIVLGIVGGIVGGWVVGLLGLVSGGMIWSILGNPRSCDPDMDYQAH